MAQDIRFWDRTARLYAPLQEHKGRQLYAALTERCRVYVTGADVLELGCGSGQLTRPLSPAAASWEATDISGEMVRAAQRRGDCPARFSVADAELLPYEENWFDVVLMANALHIMPSPERALAEIRRVLRPGGILLIPTFVYEGKIPRLRMWFLGRMGFRTYHRWKLRDLAAFVEKADFRIKETALLPGHPLTEGWVAAEKPKNKGSTGNRNDRTSKEEQKL